MLEGRNEESISFVFKTPEKGFPDRSTTFGSLQGLLASRSPSKERNEGQSHNRRYEHEIP